MEFNSANKISLAGFLSEIYGFYQLDRQKILIFGSLAAELYVVHYWLMGSHIAAYMFCLVTIRMLVAYFVPKNLYLMDLFLLIGLWFGINQYSIPTDILPIASYTLAIIAYFQLDGLMMRIMLFMSSSCVFINAFLMVSTPGMLVEGVAILLHIRASGIHLLEIRNTKNSLKVKY